MAAYLYNLAKVFTATTGTGTITLGAAVDGFLTFAQAGVADGARVSYGISDGVNSEAGRGVYTSSGTTMTRVVRTSTNSNNAISLSGSAVVFITSIDTDFNCKGADIASATTVNLDLATGDLVDVTGTTTITAITLAEGRECTVRFTGALTLTASGTLVLQTSANITTAAGDFAIFRGYAGNVVRCVDYIRFTGNPVNIGTTGATVPLLNGANTWSGKVTINALPLNTVSWLGVSAVDASTYIGGFTNSNATSGDLLMIMAVGPNANDGNSVYVNFVDAGANTLQGSIKRGALNGAVTFNTTSDRHAKDDFKPTTRGIDALMKIDVLEYHHRLDETKTRQQGLVAQEIYAIYPEAVSQPLPNGEDDFQKNPWSIDYGRLTPLLIRAIQELKGEIETLKKKP